MDELETTGRTQQTVEVEDAADAYLAAFDANGVDYFFNSPGTEYAPLWDHFAADAEAERDIPTSNHGIGYVGCRHEELAIHMAMGYGLMTGDPQVVGFHVNVGSLHAAMSIHGAYRSRIPMVILTSHADTHERERRGGTPGSHYLNFDAPGGFEDYFSRYVKWLAHPERNANATRHLARAFRVAASSPAGPVLLNVSRELLYDEDVQRAEIIREVAATPPAPSPDVTDRIAEKLTTATNPLIISGKIGRNAEVVESLVTLAERLEAPVVENPKWHHGFPSDHPLSLGSGAFVSHYLEKDVDLVLVLDSMRPWYPPEQNAPDDAEIVVVSPEPVQEKLAYWNYPADLLVTGDPAATLSGLLERVSANDRSRPVDWRTEHEQLRAHWRTLAERGEGETPVDPFWLCGELDRVLPDDAVIVDETTVHKTLVSNLIETRDRTFIGAGRALAGGRGGGLGMALGAKLAAPDRPVVALLGDGAYSYNPVSAALGAAQEYRLPFLTILFNNEGYQSQKETHTSYYPEGRAAESGVYPGTSIHPQPDYGTQAEAWGGAGRTVEDPDDVAEAVRRGLRRLDAGQTALLNVLLKTESPRAMLDPPAGDF